MSKPGSAIGGSRSKPGSAAFGATRSGSAGSAGGGGGGGGGGVVVPETLYKEFGRDTPAGRALFALYNKNK